MTWKVLAYHKAPMSSEISELAHAQSNVLHIKYAEKTDN